MPATLRQAQGERYTLVAGMARSYVLLMFPDFMTLIFPSPSPGLLPPSHTCRISSDLAAAVERTMPADFASLAPFRHRRETSLWSGPLVFVGAGHARDQ